VSENIGNVIFWFAALTAAWKQRVKNQPKSPFKNQPTPTIDTSVRVRLKPDSKERVFRPEQKPAYIFSLCS